MIIVLEIRAVIFLILNFFLLVLQMHNYADRDIPLQLQSVTNIYITKRHNNTFHICTTFITIMTTQQQEVDWLLIDV